jgi:AraC-like DNA-binding protein
MKAILEDIKKQQGPSSFYAYRFTIPFFEFKWHYHPEYELTYILKGNGFRLVGDSHLPFQDGDLVLLGSNLPHTWIGKSDNDIDFEAVVIQFSDEFITRFLDLEETVQLKMLIEKAINGLSFIDLNTEVKVKLMELVNVKGLNRITQLLTVLNQLSQSTYEQLSSNHFQFVLNKESEMRINKVCVYLQNHFKEKITLKQIADLIHLSESNFCKFFKKATGKTYTDYLNAIRINEVCYLLLQSDKAINEIAFESGFETLSYFNRVFARKKGSTPGMFRKMNKINP